MLTAENNFTKMAGNVLAVLALCGAYQVDNTLAWAGIVYYLICIAAIVFRYSGAKYVAWGAVGFHVDMVSYALWNWQTAGVRPCHFCFIAAGLALLAAVALQRLPLAVWPLP